MKSLLLKSLMFFVCLCGCPIAICQQSQQKITVLAVDASGGYIRDAIVRVEEWSHDPSSQKLTLRLVQQGRTNENGLFRSQLPVGEYELQVNALHFEPHSRRIAIREDGNDGIRMQLMLRPLNPYRALAECKECGQGDVLLSGFVVDPVGAVILGAIISERCPEKKSKNKVCSSTTTDSDGRYRLRLSSGKKEIWIESQGFERQKMNIVLAPGLHMMDVALAVGKGLETVTLLGLPGEARTSQVIR